MVTPEPNLFPHLLEELGIGEQEEGSLAVL